MELVHWDCLESFVDRREKTGFDVDAFTAWVKTILEAFGLRGIMGKL